MSEKTFKIEAYNSQQLANMYGVSYRVFLRWIKPFRQELGEQIAKTWTPKQVKIIVDKLDVPTHL